ncbi:hypothetical protein DMA11_19290 [Marinilabiliaceae bacterium JC017]|nr:hypothetical protein DMA11_19290 [Marinilabiliaceae bacterium JC017]
MKKISLLILLTFSLIEFIYAQDQGKIILGGNICYYYNKDQNPDYESKYKSTSFTFAPVAGFMVSSKVAIGFKLKYKQRNTESTSEYNSYTEKTLTFSPFLRIHKNISDKLKFYIEPYVGKIFILEGKDDRDQNYYAGSDFGLLYFISSKLSMELILAEIYYSHKKETDTDNKSSTFSMDYNLTYPNLGLKYYF